MNARSGNGRTDLNAYRRLPLIRRFVREERERGRERENNLLERERERGNETMVLCFLGPYALKLVPGLWGIS